MMKKSIKRTMLCVLLCLVLAISMIPNMNVSVKVKADPLAAVVDNDVEDVTEPDGGDNGIVYMGDVDGDKQITPKDVTTMRRSLAGGWGVTVKPEDGDVDGDGKITSKDVTLIRRYLAGGWGVTLPIKSEPVLTPEVVRENSLNSIDILFNMDVPATSNSDVTVYYLVGDEKNYLTVKYVRTNENILNVVNETNLPQDEMIYVEYKGVLAGSFKSVSVDADSVCVIVVPDQVVRAGTETTLQYSFLDQNGVDITSLYGSILNGYTIIQPVNAAVTSYVAGNKIYMGTPYEECTVKVSYNWTDSTGIMHVCEAVGKVSSIPEDPWQLGYVSGVITLESEQDYVNSDRRTYNNVKTINPLTMDYEDVVLQVAIPYSKYGQTVIDTLSYASALNIASYPDSRYYTSYKLMSSDESVVMIGNINGNKAKLILNKPGSANILVHGILPNGAKDVIGVIPVQLFPKKNPLLDNPDENYVYNNVMLSEMIVTAANADDFVTETGTKNSGLAKADCSMDAPEANVIQIAVPYTNIDGTIYGGFNGGPLSTEFTEYVVESSDESVIEIGEIVSGKCRFTCKSFGVSTITVYGKSSEGEMTLLVSKEIKVSRGKTNSPVAESAKQVSLNTFSVTFDRNVEEKKLWTGDFGMYYFVNGTVKVYPYGSFQIVSVTGNTAIIKCPADFVQGNMYFVEFVGDTVANFTAVEINANSVYTIIVDSKRLQANVPEVVTYRLLDKNGVDITAAQNVNLTGAIQLEIKEQSRYPFAMLDGKMLSLTEDNTACIVQVKYSWYDGDGILNEKVGEAIYSTDNGVLFPETGSYAQGDYPVESVPVRMEVYTYDNYSAPETVNKKINAAYEYDCLNILVKVFDQYDESMDGVDVNVDVLASSVAGYTGTATLTSGEVYVLNAADVSGLGVLNLKLTCGDGAGELTKVTSLLVGSKTISAKYIPIISKNVMDTAITQNSESDSIQIRLEGMSSDGFRTRGASIRFIEATPKAGETFAAYYTDGEFVYTVSKDERILKYSELSTLNGSNNIFSNVIKGYNDYAIKMYSGVYDLKFYQVRNINGKVMPTFLGTKQFTVVDTQPKLVVTPGEYVDELPEISEETISQAYDVTFDGAKVDSRELLYNFTINGNRDTAYINSVSYVFENLNGLGKFAVTSKVDGLVKKVADTDEPTVIEPSGTLTDWTIGEVSSIVTSYDAVDYVVNNAINPNCKKINNLTMDYCLGRSAIQIAVPYTKDGVTVIETQGNTSVSGYTDYMFKSKDELIVMIGEIVSGNRTKLLYNNLGNTTIEIYGIRPDGNIEHISDMNLNIVPAKKATTFTVTSDKKMLNTAYSADGIWFNAVLCNQYGEIINGENGVLNYLINGQEQNITSFNSSGSFVLRPAMLPPGYANSSGLIHLVFKCADFKMDMVISLGNEPVAQSYIPVLSGMYLSIANANLDMQRSIYVSLKGISNGFDTPGAPVEFTETPVNEIVLESGVQYVYNVKKDGVLQKESDLPTKVGNAFYNCIPTQDGGLITMSPGEYMLEFYKITGGETTKKEVIGTGSFMVTG